MAKDAAQAEVNRSVVEAVVEARAEQSRMTKAEEDYQRVLAQHTASSVELEDAKALNVDLNADRQWMRDYGAIYIANAIMDTLEVDATCRAREVDTEGELKAASNAYNTLVVPILAQVEECLAADDYVDRLRDLFEPEADAEGETEGEAQG
ncbi:hypothetical protein Hanom_Chr16g01468841 [Helianthus anomalus]